MKKARKESLGVHVVRPAQGVKSSRAVGINPEREIVGAYVCIHSRRLERLRLRRSQGASARQATE